VSTRKRDKRALPTFFVIGAPKAGTTSLHFYLDQHPQIQMSTIKEPNYFAPTYLASDERWRVGNLDDYEQLFNSAFAVRGEASPGYSMYPLREGVPERIKERVPEAKFVYLVRDPVERTVSHYHHLVASNGERRSLDEMLDDLSDPRSPCVCASLYALQLELYLRQFPETSVLVIDQAELLADRHPTLSRIFSFLEVEDTLNSSSFDVEILKSSDRRTYPPLFARFVELTVQPRLRWLPPQVRRSLRRSGERVLLPPLKTSPLSDALRSRLADLYVGEAERLRALTGETFASWSI
jgi:sulfotransferase family protein